MNYVSAEQRYANLILALEAILRQVNGEKIDAIEGICAVDDLLIRRAGTEPGLTALRGLREADEV